MKTNENYDDFLGKVTEITEYFDTREEMHKAAKEELHNGASMYPEITVDTWDRVQIDFSDLGSNDTIVRKFVWAPKERDEKEDILKIYENIGDVSNKKSARYTVDEPLRSAREVREMYVVIPDGWEAFESFSGKKMISSPYNLDMELCVALSCVDGNPALKIQKRDGEIIIKMLESIDMKKHKVYLKQIL